MTITKAAQDAQYKQTIGSTNCMQCAVAYILGLPVCDVPDFSARSSALMAWEEFDAFILSRGFSSVILPPGFLPESDYLASGSTMRGTKHIVVMNDGRLVFDPHPSNDGLVSIDCIRLIAKNHPLAALQDKAGEVANLHSRGMFVARLENMQANGDAWLTIPAVLALLNDCDMLASSELAAQPAPVVPDDVARDAARYRLIRDGGGWPAAFAAHDAPEPLRGDDLDAAMIAASQQKGGQHG